MSSQRVVFVGQGPNRACWEHGLAAGANFALFKFNFDEADPRMKVEALAFAERYAAKVAITGSVGKKLAALGGWKCNLRFGGYARRNLNARWNGKKGKGDAFDANEARIRASLLLGEPFDRYVLLGDAVARAFGIKPEPLNVVVDYLGTVRKEFLLFPHPSGVNLWWNEEFNRFRARKRLREFLQLNP